MLKTYVTALQDRGFDASPIQLENDATAYPTKAQAGFTLFEIAIVLTAIGLLTGIILTGQSLISAAKLNTVINEYRNYQNAVAQFRLKYMNLPGDMPNARAVWGDAGIGCTNALGPVFRDGTCDGNGNRVIRAGGTAARMTSEGARAWQHLALAGMIDGNYTGMTTTPYNNSFMPGLSVPLSKYGNGSTWAIAYTDLSTYNSNHFYNKDYTNFFVFSKITAAGHYSVGTPLITVADAFYIDSKLDDGLPASGNVQVFATVTRCTTSVDYNDFTGVYKMTHTGANACALFLAR